MERQRQRAFLQWRSLSIDVRSVKGCHELLLCVDFDLDDLVFIAK